MHRYRKLGMALVDMAITNLYVLWSKCDPDNRRNAHMFFQTKLANGLLFDTDWNR